VVIISGANGLAVAFYNFTTFDILANLAFGEPFGVLANRQYNEFMKTLFGMLWVFSVTSAISMTPGLGWFFSQFVQFSKIGQEARTHFKKLIGDVVRKRQAKVTAQKDFMSHIMSFEGDKGLSQVELEGNVEILVAAGRCVSLFYFTLPITPALSNIHNLAFRLKAKTNDGGGNDIIESDNTSHTTISAL